MFDSRPAKCYHVMLGIILKFTKLTEESWKSQAYTIFDDTIIAIIGTYYKMLQKDSKRVFLVCINYGCAWVDAAITRLATQAPAMIAWVYSHAGLV